MPAKKAQPFDAVHAALAVRAREISLAELTPEQQVAVRKKLSHTGNLQTEILRRQANPKVKPLHSTLVPVSRPGGFYS
mgnify:CR=1 FL=1